MRVRILGLQRKRGVVTRYGIGVAFERTQRIAGVVVRFRATTIEREHDAVRFERFDVPAERAESDSTIQKRFDLIRPQCDRRIERGHRILVPAQRKQRVPPVVARVRIAGFDLENRIESLQCIGESRQ